MAQGSLETGWKPAGWGNPLLDSICLDRKAFA